MTETELLRLKKQVEEASKNVSELNGQKSAQLKQLKEDWGCSTVEQGEKKLKTMQKEIETLSTQIEQKTEELEEKYNLIEE